MISENNEDLLSKRIDKALERKKGKHKKLIDEKTFVNVFSRLATELLAGLLIGAGIGWTIDTWLGTTPWFLVLFFLLGGVAGILNLWRVVSGKGLKIGYFN